MKVAKLSSIYNVDGSIGDYLRLMKPRVMSLVVFTALVGLLLAPGKIHPLIAIISIICVSLGAGSAASINMWYDRDIDSVMKRTLNRPIVTGKIMDEEALSFGVVLGFLSIVMMALCVNFIAALLLAIAILYYVFVYTIFLKRRSIYNVVIGGVSGALPPVIGWVSVTNTISTESIVLFLIIFFWTPPHSWALALYRADDYNNCKIPMLPVVKGLSNCRIQILLYAIVTYVASLSLYFFDSVSIYYLLIASLSGAAFIYYCLLLFIDKDILNASKKLFIYSIIYLFIIFCSLLLPN